jgi:hypothetical protein
MVLEDMDLFPNSEEWRKNGVNSYNPIHRVELSLGRKRLI